MLAGELHNSSASSPEYMKPIWDNLAALHLNTVIGTVNWELTEPEEGRFDFTLVDAHIGEARRRNMRLVLIWFGTYKTALSSYVPQWVKADRKRFPPMVLSPKPKHPPFIPFDGLMVGNGGIGALTPFGDFDGGKWIPGRRLNGDEAGAGLPTSRISLLRVKLLRFD